MEEVKEIKFKNIHWIHLLSPDHETLQKIQEKHAFHELDIEDCLSISQRSKIDEYAHYLFIVFHFPYFNKRTKQIEIEEVDIFIGQEYLYTIHHGKLKVLDDFFEKLEKNANVRKEFFSQGTGYLLYQIVSDLFESCFPILDAIDAEVNSVEKDVFDEERQQRDMLKDIMRLKKSVITFYRLILPQRAVVAQLEHKNKKFLPENLEVYFDDIVDQIEKIYNNLENSKALVQSLQDTNESIISHRTNNIMKVLTIFSVVMLPLTLISGIYGMNISTLPFAETQTSFQIIIGGMLGVVVIMLFFFKFKKWL